MTLVRSHLRLGAGTWLLCHLLTGTTLLACDCCPTPGGSAAPLSAEAPCHETAPPPEPHCAHMTDEGAACPMPRGASTPAVPDCAVSGACGTADAMLQAVLLQPAVLSAAVALDLPRDVPAPSATDRPSTVSLAVPPDPLPPRA